ncbi:MerR family transcriptional regulator [Agromyces seonyuensis]|uniref:MerR family transcriptional regulator n=1 Tax=Agromyces seonyuensis TaxID=2662446 RepID=A0A6I4NVM7_9MICO|nr:MerR family transcriptional regulator [Agromyces seonyuensis]
MTATASANARGPEHRFSIGAVLARLQPEFPELTGSKVRFLEEQGLVTPARSASGYRKFSDGDVERIAHILAMQRDHYLPLKVIRAQLDAVDDGSTPALPGATAAPPAARYTRSQLVEAAGATTALLDQAVSASLLPPAEHYGDDSLAMLRALAGLAAAGVEPRHLRGVRGAVDREAGIVEAAVSPLAKRADAAGRARAAEHARELGTHLEAVHSLLLRSAVGRIAR